MCRQRALLTLFASLLLLPSCGPRFPRHGWFPFSRSAAVVLVLEGSAFQRPEVTKEVVTAIEAAAGRQAVVVPGFSTAMDPTRQRLAARLTERRAELAAYDWKEPRCTADAATVTALNTGAAGAYRITLDYVTRLPPRRGHGRSRGAARRNAEERLFGSIALVAFTENTPPRPIQIDRVATHRGETVQTLRIDIGAVVGEAVRKLPILGAPDWDGFARHLLKTGCPLLAVAVADSRLEKPDARRLTDAALAAMEHSKGDRPSPVHVHVVRREPGASAKQPESPPNDAHSNEVYSCSDLCGLHMIELCNNDRVLWSYNRRKWEATRCGAKREDEFLVECYRQQWVSGTFQDSCVTPCETDPEGRERLRNILEGAGCFANGAS